VAQGWGIRDAVNRRVAVMNTLLEDLIEEKQRLRTQLVQIQTMLRLIDDRILEELLMGLEGKDEPVAKKVDQR
jgi:hypothetical protein